MAVDEAPVMLVNSEHQSKRSFVRDSRGNVAAIAALTIIPILCVAGIAIDFQMAITQKNKIQAIIDSAVIAGSKAMQAGQTEDQIRVMVRDYVSALVKVQDNGLTCSAPTLVFLEGTQDIEAGINCSQATTLSQLMHRDKIDFRVTSGTTYGVGNVDVAFIFDVSGSMNSNNRLENLKTSAKTAFDELLPDDRELDGTVRIALTTYNSNVNAGEYFDNVTRKITLGTDASSGSSSAKSRYDAYNNRVLIDQSTGKRFFYYERATCSGYCGYNSSWTITPKRRWFETDIGDNTCVSERVGVNAFTDAAGGTGADDSMIAGNPLWNWNTYNSSKGSGSSEVEYGGANSSSGAFNPAPSQCENSSPLPLTEDKSKLDDYVDALHAGGGTAGHLGIAWGWYLISPSWNSIWPSASHPWPWDEPDTAKAIILMTDGEFNQTHPSIGQNSIQLAMEFCDAMKEEPYNVQIYSVGFQVPSSAAKTPSGETILDYCATDAGHSFTPNNGEELTDAYRAIAQSISDLRITR
ncbi:MAG: pilus assembly protein [Hyphomonas oceanitis]|uniref:pilus assembly protein n=1 Tax=Hyphomonas oceanitis TaxID=81033 RepID=UPI0030027FC3